MPSIGRFTIGVLVLAMVGALAAAAAVAVETPKPSDWKISGQLEEACSCDAACPCWMDSKPTHMNCGGGQVLFIEKGSYAGVPLDGLAIGMIGQSPDGMAMMESVGRWPFLYLYLDAKATPEQRPALESLAREITPPLAPPERTKTFWVPILRTIAADEHEVRFGDDWRFSGHLVPGGLGGTTKIVNPPGADPFHAEYLQGKTSANHSTLAGHAWDWKGTNYMYGNFDVDSAQYAKFTQAMMQAMQKAEEKK